MQEKKKNKQKSSFMIGGVGIEYGTELSQNLETRPLFQFSNNKVNVKRFCEMLDRRGARFRPRGRNQKRSHLSGGRSRINATC